MPHAPYCTRDKRPSFWKRIRYGVFAKQAMALEKPCEFCRRIPLMPSAVFERMATERSQKYRG